MPHDPCRTPLIKPRERLGQLSIAKAAPAGHSAPMPKPSSARNTNRNQKVGAKPAIKLQSEYHRIEIISGMRRPTRSPSQPEHTAPTKRIHKVTVNTTATSVSGTPNSCEIGSIINRKIVKSNESRVQPSQAATQAYHWSFVGSFHHGIGFVISIAAIVVPPCYAAPALEPDLCTSELARGPPVIFTRPRVRRSEPCRGFPGRRIPPTRH